MGWGVRFSPLLNSLRIRLDTPSCLQQNSFCLVFRVRARFSLTSSAMPPTVLLPPFPPIQDTSILLESIRCNSRPRHWRFLS